MTKTESSKASPTATPTAASMQRLHLVFGGELQSLESHEFQDLSALDVVGIFPDYASAYTAWKSAAQRTVDNAMMRYFIVHMHRLLEPDQNEPTP